MSDLRHCDNATCGQSWDPKIELRGIAVTRSRGENHFCSWWCLAQWATARSATEVRKSLPTRRQNVVGGTDQ